MRELLVITALILVIMLSGCGILNFYTGQVPVIKENWGIELPSGSREIYFNMLESVFGDGPRYTVLEYNDNTKLENLLDWTETDADSVNEAKRYIEDLNDCLKDSGKADETVPDELVPDFAKLRMYKTDKDDGYDCIIIFYDDSTNRLYIAEHF